MNLTARQSAIVGCALASFLGAASARSLELQVSPDGNDAWSGRLPRPEGTNGPLASLVGARDAVRKLKASGALTEPVRIVVAEGTYRVLEPLELTPEDSGSAQSPIIYEAVPGARPVFSGGQVIRGWSRSTNGLWQTRVEDVAAGRWYFEQLWVNDRRAVRARSPNRFFSYMLDIFEEGLAGNPPRPNAQARQTVRLRPEVFQILASLSSGELKDVNFVAYHNWDITRRFIDRLDAGELALLTVGERMKWWNPWRRNGPFILENFRTALDEPGEWFLARDGTLSYLPRPGEDMTRAEVIAPVAGTFLKLTGHPAANQFVEHVTFKGLAFRHSQWITPPEGFEPSQAASTIDAVVMADGARHVTFDDCEIGHTGIYGIWFRRGCRDNVIRHCYLHDLGAGGVRLGDMSIAANEAERTKRIRVDNNIIQHGGRIFPCAVGVWIGQSAENQITHNDVGDFYYTGISVGWTWGYGDSLAKSNTIAFNRIHHLGWCVLSDMAGIYTLGRSEGTVVTNNFINRVDSYSYGGWGLYTDEGSSGILFENNFVCGTKTGGFHQHYGRENVVRNNLFALSWHQQLQASRVEPHRSFTFENNIVYYDRGDLFSSVWDKVQSLTRSNCYWKAPDGAVRFGGKTLAEWQAAGQDQGSIVADPKFADPELLDFRLFRDSEAVRRVGFKPFDYSQAGVHGEVAWIEKSRREVYPEVEVPPDPPAAPVRDTFERYAAGQPPQGAEAHVEKLGDAIVVTDETAAAGKHSLKFTDAPGLTNAYNPHLVYQARYRDGTVRNSFELRLERGAFVTLEWRDWRVSQYRTGPRFDIRNGALWLGTGRALELPTGQWIRFEVTAGLGTRSNGKWTLQVTVPGQVPHQFTDQPFGSEQFEILTWVGIVSMATTNTVFYLDDFELRVD